MSKRTAPVSSEQWRAANYQYQGMHVVVIPDDKGNNDGPEVAYVIEASDVPVIVNAPAMLEELKWLVEAFIDGTLTLEELDRTKALIAAASEGRAT